MAKSRAGEGLPSIPYQLKTLDRQVPLFKISSTDPACQDDDSCLIKWIIEADGGSPISRAEISYARVNHESILLKFLTNFLRFLGSRRKYYRTMESNYSTRTVNN
jgi:hypothetical protein